MPRSSAKLRRIALTAVISLSVSVLPVSTTNAAPGPPSVIGANSTGNTSVLVIFDEPMSSDALDRERYRITQENVNPEAGTLRVVSAAFDGGDRSHVVLETLSQAELVYRVTVIGADDRDGEAIGDGSSATFSGTPPDVDVDSDGDGLADHVESRGWTVRVQNFNGTITERGVTSNPDVADSDGDGLSDAEEASMRLDPRAADTDDDRLDDRAEVQDLYSDPLAQDTDGDGITDNGEVAHFRTSPVLADTDGDQLLDRDEIIGTRNPRVSDLPRPEIDVGEVRLGLDVRFSETNATEQRTLDTKSVTTTLTQSESRSFSRQDTVNVEAHLTGGFEAGTDGFKVTGESGLSLGYTFQQTSESQRASERAREQSLATDREATRGFVVERHVDGGTMQVALSLRNDSTLAYRVENLQVTAFIQDPRDRTKLTPIATLVADVEPESGFTLGPLVADRGPFIFSNTTIEPNLVDSLMANSSGLVFRISNYDIVDEAGRNFAFTSQEVVERTSRVVIDFGGARSLRAQVGDEDAESEPGETELHRVSTSTGRAVADTNRDGRVDDDPRELFDADGNSLGIDVNGDGEVTDQSYTVLALAWSPDGRRVATAGDDGRVRIWSATTGRVLFVLAGHVGPVNAIDWSSDGTTLATAGADGTVRLWSAGVDDDKTIWRPSVLTDDDGEAVGHDGEATAVAWSPDGNHLATGGADSNVLVVDMSTGMVTTWPQHRLGVTALAWTSDSRTLASSASGGDVRIWDVEGKSRILRFAAHTSAVNDVEWSPNDTTLATAASDGDVELWEVRLEPEPTASSYLELNAGDEPVNTIAWSPDGTAIATAGDDALIRIWDPAAGTSDRTLAGHGASIGDIAWSNAGSQIASAAVDQQVITWSTVTDQLRRTITGLDDDTYVPDERVAFDASGKEVGITLHEALRAIGLVRYDENVTKSDELTFEQRLASYSTEMTDDGEQLVRIRGVSNDDQRSWEVLTPLGIDADANVGDLIVTTDSAVSLNFVQDLDGDLLTADVEYFLRTSDSAELIDPPAACGGVEQVEEGRDTDGDCLDDRFEALIGWEVDIGIRRYRVWSSPNRADSNSDDPDCTPDASSDPPRTCELPYDGSDTYAAPEGWNDNDPPNGLRDPGEVPRPSPVSDAGSRCDGPSAERDYVLDPIRLDTDRDGISDADEINGFIVEQLDGPICVRTNPLRQDTDGDTFPDGIERTVGLDPTNSEDTDTDGDGLPDIAEDDGWTVTFESVSTDGHVPGDEITFVPASDENCSEAAPCISSDPENPDSDGDGLSDLDEFLLNTNPRNADTDGDGIGDEVELNGFVLPHEIDGRDAGIITTDPLDADSDNDRRADGAEAELDNVEADRWVVRVLGEAPYRVFSHPLVADADFDRLVDGVEFAIGTDPNDGNTDGDRRADDAEVDLATLGLAEIGLLSNPLAEDLRVTLVARSLEVSSDTLESYALTVRTPADDQRAGLAAEPQSVFDSTRGPRTIGNVEILRNPDGYVGILGFRYTPPFGGGPRGSRFVRVDPNTGRVVDPGALGVVDGSEMSLLWTSDANALGETRVVPDDYVYEQGALGRARYAAIGSETQPNLVLITVEGGAVRPQDAELESRSVSFGIAEGQRLSVEGFVRSSIANPRVELGGLEGELAQRIDPNVQETTTIRPVFSWGQVNEIADKFIEDYVFDVEVDGISVKLQFYLIVQ